jgi:hypothetical protein
MHRPTLVALTVLVLACGADKSAEQAFDPERPYRKPGDVIDSIFPMDTMVARFRQGVPEVTALSGGAPSRDSLVRRFLTAVETRDSQAIQEMVISRPEFAWLVFPDHIYHEPPYELDPKIFWLQLSAPSSKGIKDLLRRYGGAALALDSLACQRDTLQLSRGEMTMWSPCVVHYHAPEGEMSAELFGSIVEHGGMAKFLSYRNSF